MPTFPGEFIDNPHKNKGNMLPILYATYYPWSTILNQQRGQQIQDVAEIYGKEYNYSWRGSGLAELWFIDGGIFSTYRLWLGNAKLTSSSSSISIIFRLISSRTAR